MQYKDYYRVMALERNASPEAIKRAYKKLARQYHPDINKSPEAETRFKELGEAYEVLRDPQKRAAYDQLGSNWRAGQEFRPPPNWAEGFEFSGGPKRGSTSPFSDFFESLFGGPFADTRGFGNPHHHRPHPGQRAHRRGRDNHSKVMIDIEQAYHGGQQTFTLRHTETDDFGRRHLSERRLKVNIPRGISPGQSIRLAGQGGSSPDGVPGDLYLEVEFKPHGLYQFEGKDVLLPLPLAPWEAALGASIKVPTPAGPVELKIPPNSKSGNKLRLGGRGIPAREPGDFYVMLQIVTPPAKDAMTRQFYEQMRDRLNFDPRRNWHT